MPTDRKAYFAEYRKRAEVLAYQRKYQKNWRRENQKRSIEIKKNYRINNGGLKVENKWATIKRKAERAALADPYLKYMLKKHMEGVVQNIPPQMIEIYRKLLLTKRLLKIKKHGCNNKRELLSGYEKSTQRELIRIINGKKKTPNSKGSK